MYMLAVSSDSQEWTIPLLEPYHVFTAPEDAPPCEVYNFSVTATYVGATYTGAGCRVLSPVLSTMLPSLPDIKRLESSLNHSLEKQSGEVTLSVYFEVVYIIIILLWLNQATRRKRLACACMGIDTLEPF